MLVTSPTQSDESPMQNPLPVVHASPPNCMPLLGQFIIMTASHTLFEAVTLEFCPPDLKRAILSGRSCVPEGRLFDVMSFKGSITKCLENYLRPRSQAGMNKRVPEQPTGRFLDQ